MRALCTVLALAALLSSAACDKKEEPIRAAGEVRPDPQFATSSGAPTESSASPKSAEGRLKVVRAPADAEVASFVRTERLRAKAEGRVLVVYAAAKWCGPCKQFHALIASGRLDARLARTELLEFDVDQDTERLAAAGYKYRFIPYFALAGADGHPARELAVKNEAVDEDAIAQLAAFQDGAAP